MCFADVLPAPRNPRDGCNDASELLKCLSVHQAAYPFAFKAVCPNGGLGGCEAHPRHGSFPCSRLVPVHTFLRVSCTASSACEPLVQVQSKRPRPLRRTRILHWAELFDGGGTGVLEVSVCSFVAYAAEKRSWIFIGQTEAALTTNGS